MKLKDRIRYFFFPPPGSARRSLVLPYMLIGVVVIASLVGGTYGWAYTNSPQFCGTTCHTMPPQNATYVVSPHANVYCSECHIGRAFIGQQIARKSQDIRELYATVFNTYEFPIRASRSRPTRETCEQCHLPEAFADDSLRVIGRFADDLANSPTSIYLIMKTGGGSKTQGLGRGIHWHIVNKVDYYSPEADSQDIPLVRVYNEDGTTTDYVDIEAGFDLASVSESQFKTMDCNTCHNRVSHDFKYPGQSVDEAMMRGLINPDIPFIRQKAEQVLIADYSSRSEAMKAIDALERYYKDGDYYPGHGGQVSKALETIREIYDLSVFHDQEVDWTTHADNLGHVNSPGCFRCHDGKHLDTQNQAIRLECNLCHSIPVVAGEQDFVANIEISRGPEPESHLNANWISLHNEAFDVTCSNCHTTEDLGGTSNISFCSNSACHGSVYTYAGFDAPALREILKDQLPQQPLTPTPAPVVGTPTFDANIGPIFQTRCVACHSAASPSAGLNLSSYADAMRSGESGPAIVPGDSDNSQLVQTQREKHFANLTGDELQLVIEWIVAGAPEQ